MLIPTPQGMLFDLDGTITEPFLDFPKIKEEMGIGQRPILEAMAELDGPNRLRVLSILQRHEQHAAATAALNHGCRELLELLRERRIPTAVITRNSRRSALAVLQRHALHFNFLVTREDGLHKPHPDGLLRSCRTLKIPVASAWMIGDGQYDVEAGLAAGALTVWLSHGRQRDFAAQPWQTINALPELITMLRECLK